VGEDDTAEESEEAGDHQRKQQRPLQRHSECQSFTHEPAADQPFAARQPANHELRLMRTRLAAQPDDRMPITLLHRLRCRRGGQISSKLAPVRSNERNRRLRIGIGKRVVDRLIKCRLSARAVDVGQDARLLGDLPSQARNGLVVRADIDEADHREIGEQREQAREQRDAKRGWHENAFTALSREHVARTSDGVEKRLLEAFIELPAKPADVHVDDIRARVEMIVPHLLEKHRPSDDATLVASEIF
jgi:hypothetical protein